MSKNKKVCTDGVECELKSHSLYDRNFSHDSCGVGFITNKSGKQTHDLALRTRGLPRNPHRRDELEVGDGANKHGSSTRFLLRF